MRSSTLRWILIGLLAICSLVFLGASTRVMTCWSAPMSGGRQIGIVLAGGRIVVGDAPGNLFVSGLRFNDPAIPLQWWFEYFNLQGERMFAVPLWMVLALFAVAVGFTSKWCKRNVSGCG